MSILGISTAKAAAVGLTTMAVLALAACGAASPADQPEATATPTETPEASRPMKLTWQEVPDDLKSRLVDANTEFGLDLFSRLAEQDSDQNVFASPLSVYIALAMTYNGASGETQQAMAEALRLDDMELEELNDAYAALRQSLEDPDSEVSLDIANSLWTREGVDFKHDFLDRNQDSYEALITALDFDSPTAPDRINQWVADNTQDKITQIVDRIDPSAVMFLINAIYFHGQWETEFDPDKTEDMPFHLPGGGEKQHPMMSQSGEYQYLENDQMQAVSLPYDGERMSMYVFLPSEDTGLDAFLDSLDADQWQQWMSEFSSQEGTVVLPRFSAEYEASLKDTLSDMGMGVAFQAGSAEFEGMFSPPPDLYLHNVKHKAVIEVDEEGTEAAAVTSVEVRVTSASPGQQEPFRLVADRPFFYAIRDNETGSILFMGTIVEPQE